MIGSGQWHKFQSIILISHFTVISNISISNWAALSHPKYYSRIMVTTTKGRKIKKKIKKY